ncbi:MAG: twin-arginine translocase TatA/TatE family subunit [Candidatus Sulfotelmatobacter sp.]
MSFSDTIFLFFLALVLFGPKKLPEMARQAGKLLAELRRASNEFRSQIETEIAHIEVDKRQTVLPPTQAPPGAVASLSLNPAANNPSSAGSLASAPAPETSATLAAPVAVAAPPASVANATPSESVPSSSAAAPAEPAAAAEPTPSSQESHVQ